MTSTKSLCLVAVFGLLHAAPAYTQTADDVVEKHIAAIGGRAALGKTTSQVATGTLAVSTQMGEIAGTVEVTRKAPNKTRSLMVLDLSAMGAANLVIDQRCDGKAAWVSNSMQGDRDISGNQLQGLLNSHFPSPLLNYKDTGGKVELTGKDTIGGRGVFALVYTPKAGSAFRFFIDAETFHIVKSVTTVDVPETGGQVEQTTESTDYREIGGIKIPFRLTMTNPMQTLTITLSKVEINKTIDDGLFAKPVAK